MGIFGPHYTYVYVTFRYISKPTHNKLYAAKLTACPIHQWTGNQEVGKEEIDKHDNILGLSYVKSSYCLICLISLCYGSI